MHASTSDWIITLEQQEYIDSFFSSKGLSVTFMNERPRRTLFSFANWSKNPLALPDYSKKEYRTYLVLHECGHALGLGHVKCSGSGPVPIMYQQTRGNKTCSKNIWPLAFEINLLA
jgi:hypothetical protein